MLMLIFVAMYYIYGLNIKNKEFLENNQILKNETMHLKVENSKSFQRIQILKEVAINSKIETRRLKNTIYENERILCSAMKSFREDALFHFSFYFRLDDIGKCDAMCDEEG
eukprot:153686_1